MFKDDDVVESTQNKSGDEKPIIPIPPVNPLDPMPMPIPLVQEPSDDKPLGD